ncbi:hypothetical protein [Legionella sp. CNM-4043-24]|uniref:hypothetical protein n=1 Tax=Legionella sp. CNM-4043-24 TaxID=3421646 RepID=UPI00403B1478
MMQVALERDHSGQISVIRNFQITEDCIASANNVVQNRTIKNFLIVAHDDIQDVEQKLAIKKFLITARKEHQHGF